MLAAHPAVTASEGEPPQLAHAGRRLSEGCSDSDGDALGLAGIHCEVYMFFPSLCVNGSFHDDDDFSAQVMCCACGGGSNETAIFTNRTVLKVAVDLWTSSSNGQTSAELQHGHINTWDVSRVTDLRQLFEGKDTFNDDIDNWDTSEVTTLALTF